MLKNIFWVPYKRDIVLTIKCIKYYLVRDINSPIHQSTIFVIEIFIHSLFVFYELTSSGGHQDAFHSIIKIIIKPNFVKKYLWIGENEWMN